MTRAYQIHSPIGALTLRETDGKITQILFGFPSPCDIIERTELLAEAERQLSEYFSGKRKEFILPLSAEGTEFQKKVWRALQEIPYGETATYGQLAGKIGSKNACRAVGGANHNNPIPIVIPCHRVIGAGNQLTGYAGGLEIKRYLLKLEQTYKETP